MSSSSPPRCRIHLHRGREKAVLQGHPWLFSGAVDRTEGPSDAPLAEVLGADGRRLGIGFHSPEARVRVRLLGPEVEGVDEDLFSRRLRRAMALREAILPPETTGYRVVNAAGDGLPGWTVDRFGDVLISQITSAGLEALGEAAYGALARAFPGCAILQKNDLAARRQEGLSREDCWITGEPRDEAEFTECGLRFSAELIGGQKTGFYCDQRDSRRRVEAVAEGRRVLDLFAHTGAFGLYALRGGAAGVTHVESAGRLVERGRQAYAANERSPENGEWVRGDVFEDLRRRREHYGIVICDPPPLIPRRRDLNRGSRAYKDLNRLALGRVEPGGFFLTFTCSSAVDGRLFRQILFAAAREAGVELSLLAPLGAAPDHPFAITHPEGEYLKGWLGTVQAR